MAIHFKKSSCFCSRQIQLIKNSMGWNRDKFKSFFLYFKIVFEVILPSRFDDSRFEVIWLITGNTQSITQILSALGESKSVAVSKQKYFRLWRKYIFETTCCPWMFGSHFDDKIGISGWPISLHCMMDFYRNPECTILVLTSSFFSMNET